MEMAFNCRACAFVGAWPGPDRELEEEVQTERKRRAGAGSGVVARETANVSLTQRDDLMATLLLAFAMHA